MPAERPRRVLVHALLLAAAVAALLLATHARHFVFTNDEGIVLEPAQRLALGESPYVDFFGYMSPGSYWIQAAIFRLLGFTLVAGRIPVILGFALQCGLVLWFTARLSTLRAAWITALLFLGFQAADASFLTTQHRWDSGTLALLGLACADAGRRRVSLAWPANAWPAAAGAAFAAAAWCTPTMGLLIPVSLAWFAWQRAWRPAVAALAGVAAISTLALALLLAHGSLGGFVAQMLWLKTNYSGVNVMPYGSVIGGYGRLFAGVSGAALAFTGLFVFFLTLPALLPPLAPLAWFAEHRRRPLSHDDATLLALLLPACAAMIATAFPRADVMHLAFVAALPAALCGAALARLLPPRALGLTSVLFALGALAFASNHVRDYLQAVPVPTAAGTLRASPSSSAALTRIHALVRPGDTLFVHPYLPVLYFTTQARNVSRFSYLNPGMMTADNEREVLAALEATPPQWALHLATTREEFLRVFPSGSAAEHHFPLIDAFLAAHYEPTDPPIDLAGYRLLQRKASATPTAPTTFPRPAPAIPPASAVPRPAPAIPPASAVPRPAPTSAPVPQPPPPSPNKTPIAKFVLQ